MYKYEEKISILEDPKVKYGITEIMNSPFVNLMMDSAFKLVLGAPENEDLLKGMIHALIPGLEIDTIEYLDKESVGFCIDDKKTIFDVYCVDKAGDRFVIEMQYAEQKDFADRMLFYSTYPVRQQLVKFAKETEAVKNKKKLKIKSYKLCPVYMVSILNFELKHSEPDPRREGLVSTFEIRNSINGELMTDSLKFVFFELGAFPYSYGELDKCKTFLQKMAYYLLYLGKMKAEPESEKEGFFIKLTEAAKRANMTQDKIRLLDKAMTTSLDIIAIKDFARDEGFRDGEEVGRKKGLRKGMQQGRLAEKRANAIAMLNFGMSKEDVCKVLTLTDYELAGLIE